MGEIVEFKALNSAKVGIFRKQFSVVGELSFHRQDYCGGQNMTMSTVPNYIHLSLTRVQSRVSKPDVGISPIIVCCIQHGLESLEDNCDVNELLELRNEFNLMDGIESDLAESVHAWFRVIPLSVPDISLSGVARLNFRIPDGLKSSLHSKAVSLGLATNTLALVCVLEILRHERAVVPNHREYMSVSIQGFMRRLRIHRVVAESLVKVLGHGTSLTVDGVKDTARRLGVALHGFVEDFEGEDRVKIITLIQACEDFHKQQKE